VGLPGVKEFNWSNITDHSSIVSASFEGIATDKATGETSKINGTLGATFSDKPFQTILSEAIGGATITTSYSGTITAVPEPATSSLMLLGGLVVAGAMVRRRMRS